jgi:regulator of ribonuclease activity A
VALTAEVLDEHGELAAVCLIQFRQFGQPEFSGHVATIRCYEDNVLLRERVQEQGAGRVLVVDGGGSVRCALLGDNIAKLALDSGWAGIVVNGCIRDAVALQDLGLGVKALGTNPRPSRKDGAGAIDVPVTFGGVTFEPGAELYADDDGVVVLAAGHPK